MSDPKFDGTFWASALLAFGERSVLTVGIYINSALYLAGCFIAGMVTHNDVAWKLALTAMGLAYVGFVLQVAHAEARIPAGTAVAASIVAGVAAGIALLWKS